LHHHSEKPASPFLVILAFATVYVVWGSTYFFIQIAVQTIPPMMLGAFRFIAAGLLMLGWCQVRGEGTGNWQQIRMAAITGLMMLFMGTGAVIWAEKWLPSSLVAILISSAPFWFVLLDFPRWKLNFRSRSILAGLFFGFLGVTMMFGERLLAVFRLTGNMNEIIGLSLLLIGTISWAGGSLFTKYKGSGSTNINSAWQMLAAGVVFLLGSLVLKEWKGFEWETVPTGAWLSTIYLIVFGSLAAYSAYIWLLKVRPAAQVSTYAYVNPVIAVVLGVVFSGEHLTFMQATGLVVILGSILMINLAKFRSERNR
jgi:drug/metabolite transporter (DMT)-like permease